MKRSSSAAMEGEPEAKDGKRSQRDAPIRYIITNAGNFPTQTLDLLPNGFASIDSRPHHGEWRGEPESLFVKWHYNSDGTKSVGYAPACCTFLIPFG